MAPAALIDATYNKSKGGSAAKNRNRLVAGAGFCAGAIALGTAAVTATAAGASPATRQSMAVAMACGT